MFNSFVSFILSLLTDAVIQAVALQVSEECRWFQNNYSLASGILWLLLKSICSHFVKLFKCSTGSRILWTSRIWYKWHKSCRTRVEITWPIFYVLISFGEKIKIIKKQKLRNYVQPLILPPPPTSPPIKLWQPTPVYLTSNRLKTCRVKVFIFKNWTSQNYMYINLQMVI